MVESRALEPLLDWEADAAWDEVAEEGGVCVVVVDAAVSGWLAWLCFMANFQAADMLRGLFFWASFCFCSSARARASASFLSIRSRFQGGRWAYFCAAAASACWGAFFDSSSCCFFLRLASSSACFHCGMEDIVSLFDSDL